MIDTKYYVLICIVGGLITLAERALPFLVFRGGHIPRFMEYLGRVLPLALMTTLVIYCIRHISFAAVGGFLPQLLGIIATLVSYRLAKNTMLSIVLGTASYMILLAVL